METADLFVTLMPVEVNVSGALCQIYWASKTTPFYLARYLSTLTEITAAPFEETICTVPEGRVLQTYFVVELMILKLVQSQKSFVVIDNS
jgi:hypothetical protein